MQLQATQAPPALAAVPVDRIVDLDVREELRAGGEPFSLIMSARQTLPPGGVLRLRAIFEPVPLYHVMAKHGLDHWTEQLGPDDWRVWFYPKAEETEGAQPEAGAHTAATGPGGLMEQEEDVLVLDVRGLEPPEPMMRTLAALEQLPRGKTLLQLNLRVPQFLLPRLDEQGFSYEIREQNENLVRIFIRHRDGA